MEQNRKLVRSTARICPHFVYPVWIGREEEPQWTRPGMHRAAAGERAEPGKRCGRIGVAAGTAKSQRCRRRRLEGERRSPWDGGTEDGEEAVGEGGGESGRRRSRGRRMSGPWKGRPAGRPRINDYGWDPASWFATVQAALSSRTSGGTARPCPSSWVPWWAALS